MEQTLLPSLEKTLIMIKPDAVRKQMTGTIISDIENKDLNITQIHKKRLTVTEASELYIEHIEKDYFPRNLCHVTSASVVLLEVQGRNAVQTCREYIEHFREKHKELINLPMNLVHASSGTAKAMDELNAVGLEK